MSKNISVALQTHLHQDVTTMATCWDITRIDGTVLAFTDHDQDLIVSGLTYKAATGYTRTAMKSDPTMAVDNIDVVGILDSAAITDSDLQGGKYDWATFHIFAINWMNLGAGPLKMAAGTFGEVEALPTGTYKVELRGLTQYLTTETANNYQPVCRADLGDTKCKVPIKPAAWTAGAGVTTNPTASFGEGFGGSYVRDPNPVDDVHALAVYQCTTGGTTASTPPAFDPTIGNTTTETTGVVWTSITPWRGVGTVSAVTSNRQFTTSVLVFNPSSNSALTPASVVFGGNASVSLTITVTVGANTRSYAIPFNYNSTDSVKYLAEAINADHSAGLIGATAHEYFSADNVHAVQISKVNGGDAGSLSKSSDTANNVQIIQGGWLYSGPGYLTGGLVTWLTGANAGTSMEIKAYDPGTTTMNLFLSMPFTVAPGDKFYFQPGCDKTRLNCFDRYDNILNFRAEPDVPGMDEFMNYPDAAS